MNVGLVKLINDELHGDIGAYLLWGAGPDRKGSAEVVWKDIIVLPLTFLFATAINTSSTTISGGADGRRRQTRIFEAVGTWPMVLDFRYNGPVYWPRSMWDGAGKTCWSRNGYIGTATGVKGLDE